jgi:hypothetical protein
VSGSASIAVEGLDIPLTSNSVEAKFVDGEVSIATSATKEVGESHTFIVTITENNGDGDDTPVAGIIPTFNLPAGLQVDPSSTCLTGTGADGTCTLVVSATEPGIYPVGATVQHTTTSGVLIERTAEATITYVAARVSVVPASAVNGVGDQHVFTVTVETNDGSGWMPAAGLVADETFFTFAFTPADPQSVVNGCADPGTDANGICSVVINNDSPGSFTLSVTVDTAIVTGGVDIPVSAFAEGTKTYVAGSLAWLKVDQTGAALGGATFDACRITESDGSTLLATPACVTVADNSGADADPAEGAFSLTNLMLGTWTVQETIAPQGYFGDFERLEQVTLSTSALDGTFQDAWVNDLFPGRTLETGTTCEMYRDGTAIVLNEVLFGTKGQTINNVAPGVFFYYTKFIAPPADFTVDLRQKNDSAFVNFLLQNAQQVRLFNGDCSTPAATFTLTFDSGQVQLDISGAVPGQEFILSAKYDTSNVVGQTAPKQPVRYDFHTDVNGVLVDQDLDGLILRKK